MIRFGFDVEIARPVDEVFAFVTDPAHLPEWQTNTVEIQADPPGPLRLGSRTHEVHEVPFGRRVEEDVEVVGFEQDRLLDLHITDGPIPVDGRWEFEGTDDRTRIHFEAHGELHGAMRLAEPLLQLGIKRQMRADHQRLKERLESS